MTDAEPRADDESLETGKPNLPPRLGSEGSTPELLERDDSPEHR
jgi:hypothetical protein